MYASRDDRLTARFSNNFCGYTGGGDFLVKDTGEWVVITKQDFAQVANRISIEMLDLSLQDLSDDVVVANALFHIHLPVIESVLSKEAVRLTLIFRLEKQAWMIVFSGISVPYFLVEKGDVYPIKSLYERNQELELLLEARTRALEEVNRKIEATSHVSHQVRTYLKDRLNVLSDIQTIAQTLNCSGRTLSRRLQQEGTSLPQIRDQLRQETAIRLLTNTTKSVETISLKIGFTSLTAFHRAFKTWTGRTPRSYRQAKVLGNSLTI